MPNEIDYAKYEHVAKAYEDGDDYEMNRDTDNLAARCIRAVIEASKEENYTSMLVNFETIFIPSEPPNYETVNAKPFLKFQRALTGEHP